MSEIARLDPATEADPTIDVGKSGKAENLRKHVMAIGALITSTAMLGAMVPRLASSDREAIPGTLPPVPSDTSPLHGEMMIRPGIKNLFRTQQVDEPKMSWANPALERAYADRPDEKGGPLVHVIYAVPEDVAEQKRDTNGNLDTRVWNTLNWQTASADGNSFRMDTANNRLDVTYVQLPYTQEGLYQQGAYAVNAIRDVLWSKQFEQDANKKKFLGAWSCFWSRSENHKRRVIQDCHLGRVKLIWLPVDKSWYDSV